MKVATFVAVVLAGRLASAPFAAADEPCSPSPIRAAAAKEAARIAVSTQRGPMPAGLKWTGIGLLAASTLPVAVAALGDCVPDEFACRDKRAAAYVVGGLMAGTGALLLVIAHARRDTPLPSVTVGRGRAAIVQRVTF